MVADALVEAADQRQLDGRLQVDVTGVVRGEDGAHALVVELVEPVVDVIERGGQAGVALVVRVDSEAEQAAGLLRHLHDRAP